METTAARIQYLKKAIATLDEAVCMPVSPIVRDATVQRFEYSFDLLWKCLKAALWDAHGFDCNSPKSCFRTAFNVGLGSDVETEILLAMADDRNATTHIYSEGEAIRVLGRIKADYLPLMQKLARSIEGLTGTEGKSRGGIT